MKKTVLLFCSLFCTFLFRSFANDTFVQHRTGGNEWISVHSDSISIEKELLQIDLFADFFHVSVDYVFRNDGEDFICEVGFPETDYAYFTEDSDEKIRNFRTTVNEKAAEITERAANIPISNDSNGEKISKFYTKNVFFNGKTKTNIHIEYDASYNKHTSGYGYRLADYFLGSAICWNKLETLILTINIKGNSYFLDYLDFDNLIKNNKPSEIETKKTNDTRTCILNYENLNLKSDTKAKIYLFNDTKHVFGLPWDYNFESFVYPEYCFSLLTKAQLRKARNLIYAFHGYDFKSKDLKEFFSMFSFYKPDPNFSEKMFNANELKNLELIRSME